MTSGRELVEKDTLRTRRPGSALWSRPSQEIRSRRPLLSYLPFGSGRACRLSRLMRPFIGRLASASVPVACRSRAQRFTRLDLPWNAARGGRLRSTATPSPVLAPSSSLWIAPATLLLSLGVAWATYGYGLRVADRGKELAPSGTKVQNGAPRYATAAEMQMVRLI